MQPNACAIRKLKDDMTGNGRKGEHYPPDREKGEKLLPHEIFDLIKPALQVGGLSGTFNILLQALSALSRASIASIHFFHFHVIATFLRHRKLILHRSIWTCRWRLCGSYSIKYTVFVCIGIWGPMVYSGDYILG
jgi:hypothetical protein